MIDWPAIRKRYEGGDINLSSLERDFAVTRQAIRKRLLKEGWVTPSVPSKFQVTVTHVTEPPRPVELPIPPDAVEIARAGLRQLAQLFENQNTIEIRDHKSLSDALAQYVKVIVTAPAREDDPADGIFIPMSKLSVEARARIRQILASEQEERAS